MSAAAEGSRWSVLLLPSRATVVHFGKRERAYYVTAQLHALRRRGGEDAPTAVDLALLLDRKKRKLCADTGKQEMTGRAEQSTRALAKERTLCDGKLHGIAVVGLHGEQKRAYSDG